MSYVLEITDGNGEIKYVSAGTAAVYCPDMLQDMKIKEAL